MDTDSEFICPRPRNPRACSNCRARKIRCLPGKDSSRGTCRRCAKFGYACSYATRSNCHLQPEPISPPQLLNHGNSQNDDDIISGLFRNRPPPAGGVDQLMDIHRRVFQEQLHQESPLDATSIPTPDSLSHLSANECDKNISMREADKLLSLFRKCNAYFPFVNIPESTSAASMAVHQPFLLLAILTVSSSRTPRLQQRTDERFRRVLSERIILYGEKSLDYVQGLLVYIAWYPLYLRPLRNQIPQYLHIVSTMIADLDLDSNLEEEGEGRNASLGCHALSSLFSSIGRRFNDTRTRIGTSLQTASKFVMGDDPVMQYLRVQDLAGRVTRYKADVHGMAKTATGDSTDGELSIPNNPEEVYEKMDFFIHELEDLYRNFPAESRNRIPIRLTRQFIKVNISSLPLMITNPNPYQISSNTPPTTDISQAISHFSEIQSFLELFLSIPPDEYIHFSIREWSQVVMTISFTSELCFSQSPRPCAPDVVQRNAWIEFQAQIRANMLIYLESLTYRMGTLSVSSASTYPDSFYMLKSVLGILMRIYAPSVNHSFTINSTDPSEIQNEHAGMNSSRCPILNGSIRETDFWRALERNTPTSASHGNTNTGGDSGGQSGNGNGNGSGSGSGFQGLDVEDLVNHPQDWPTVFEEWVVDLNNLPE